MSTQLFHDLAASEEASGYHDNAAQLRAVPELLEALQSSTAALIDFQREAGGPGILPKLDWQIAENLQIIARAALAPFRGEIAS